MFVFRSTYNALEEQTTEIIDTLLDREDHLSMLVDALTSILETTNTENPNATVKRVRTIASEALNALVASEAALEGVRE